MTARTSASEPPTDGSRAAVDRGGAARRHVEPHAERAGRVAEPPAGELAAAAEPQHHLLDAVVVQLDAVRPYSAGARSSIRRAWPDGGARLTARVCGRTVGRRIDSTAAPTLREPDA